MDASTINSDTFAVYRGDTRVPGSVRYISASRVAVFYPDAPLLLNRRYGARLSGEIRNRAGQRLARNEMWVFHTTSGNSLLGDGMHLYFGDIHSHTSYSDGVGTPSDAFATARANGLDFFAVTDHSNQLDAREWRDIMRQAEAATVSGRFVGLRGFEFSHPKGHINVLDTDVYVSEGDARYDTLPEFYTWLAAQPTAIGQFNHPWKDERYDWNFDDFAYDPLGATRMYLCETLMVYPGDQYLLGLQAGWRIGAVQNLDAHQAVWGRWKFMGLVAPNLTREAILEALRARRTFSMAARDFAVTMRANGQWMGAVISNTATLDFVVTTYSRTPQDQAVSLTLCDNGVPVTSTRPISDAVWFTWTPRVPGSPGHFYYVKAYHNVLGELWPAYTSPVWTDNSPIREWKSYLPIVLKSSTNEEDEKR